MDVTDPSARFWGKEGVHRLAGRADGASAKAGAAPERLQRVEAILKADTVTTREGMLLVATSEV